MDLPVCDTLILSDVHLGADVSRAWDATAALKSNSFRRLILLGDIFADLNFGRLKKEHWQFLGMIRKLSNPKRKIEVIWVEGNHDTGLTDIMSHLVGVRVYQEYTWTYEGKRHLAIHGHQFDGFVVNNVRFNYIFGTLLYLQLQKLDSNSKVVTRFLDRLNTRWLRMSSKVAAGALHYARQRRVDRIFCGHTHQAQHAQQDGIDYYNSGSWIDARPTYITIGNEGVRIHEYLDEDKCSELHEPGDDRDSSQERVEADSALADFADEAGLPADGSYDRVGS